MKKWIALLSAVLLTLSCAMAESSDTAHTEILSFDANPTTGYSWVGFVLGGEAVQLDSAEGTYIPDDQTGMLCGAGGQTQYVVTAVKYSLQGTTQGRYLTGGVPPVRFSM